MQQHYIYLHTMIRLQQKMLRIGLNHWWKTILTVVLRRNLPMMGNGSTAGPLTLRMVERKWLSVVRKEDPLRDTVDAVLVNRSLFRWHLLWESGFWPAGKYGGFWRVDKCSRLQVQLIVGLSPVIYWIGAVVHVQLNTSSEVLTTLSCRAYTKAV